MKNLFVAIATTSLLTACGPSESETYTLYRNSVLDRQLRIHLATFDAKSGEAYNQENCEIAKDLFQKQPGVIVRYWCEKGKYRP